MEKKASHDAATIHLGLPPHNLVVGPLWPPAASRFPKYPGRPLFSMRGSHLFSPTSQNVRERSSRVCFFPLFFFQPSFFSQQHRRLRPAVRCRSFSAPIHVPHCQWPKSLGKKTSERERGRERNGRERRNKEKEKKKKRRKNKEKRRMRPAETADSATQPSKHSQSIHRSDLGPCVCPLLRFVSLFKRSSSEVVGFWRCCCCS